MKHSEEFKGHQPKRKGDLMGYQEEKKILKEELDKKFSTLAAEENEG